MTLAIANVKLWHNKDMAGPQQDYERDCVLYLRKSKGRAGIARQRKENCAYADRLRWRVVAEFIEPNTTAFAKIGEEDAPRPEYDRMLDYLQRDNREPALGILAWHADRLSRNTGETRPFTAICAKGGHLIETPRSGRYDLSLPIGRKRFRDDVSDAEGEVDHMIERIDSAKAEAAASGKYLGGPRPFGFKRDGVRHREEEAAAIRDACDAVLAGTSLAAIARDWTTRGLRTTRGGLDWDATAVRRVLLRPRNAGLMVWRGEVVGKAEWKKVVKASVWRSVVRVLQDPARRTSPGPEPRWLGTNIYVCGVCERARLVARTAGRGPGRKLEPAYRCGPGEHVSRDAELLDRYVVEHVVARLSRPDARDLLLDEAREDLAKLDAELLSKREELGEWRGSAVAGEVSLVAFKPVERRLLAEISEIEAVLVRPDRALILRDLIEAEDVGAAWLETPLDRQRAVLRELFVVTVRPAPRGRPKGWRPGEPYFDTAYVDVDPA